MVSSTYCNRFIFTSFFPTLKLEKRLCLIASFIKPLRPSVTTKWCRHEVAGVVTEVGSKVEKFKVGDKVGVGCLVDSCRTCQNCDDNLENYCPQYTLTYGAKYRDGTITYGGYSNSMVADEHFVIRIPYSLALDAAAPLLCAGITVYSPLRYYGLDKPDLHVGVVRLGGLGHMAVKFAKAFGAKVTVISTSPSKKDEGIQHLGAFFLDSKGRFY
ncbi:probable mannitol dehydrogenase [Glycine soja]|uniref:probable mannitol dehydrogenase n=1 Tax=Glycine soja TaxID=3848 RepID=UPI00103B90E4|nr:probable mannitol dehydrogenase [Glycine soja]